MKRNKIIVLVVIFVIGILWVLPMIWPVSTSLRSLENFLKNPNLFLPLDGATTQFYKRIWSDTPIGRWYFNSFLVSAVVTLVATFIDFMAAYPLAKLKFYGSRIINFMTVLCLMIPFTILLVPLYNLMDKFGLTNTYLGIILPQLVSPFGVFLLRNYLVSIPDEYIEAAKIDGANMLKIAFRIIFPLAIPGIVTVIIFTFLGSWNNLLWPLVIAPTRKMFTLTVGLTSVTSGNVPDYNIIMATASVLSGVPLYILFFFVQKYIIKGLAMQSGLK